jgi:7,8-dihydropterin-6-yl-methyl-4-(beta-D-ribofuranosyl)aminobenzene 5'-phosphate synthase
MEVSMTNQLKRRDFLMGCAAVGGAATAEGFTCVGFASAAGIDVPVVDKLWIRVLVDGSQNLFQRPAKVGNVSIEPPPRQQDYRRALHNQWGLSLYIQSQRSNEQRTIMLDFGYTPEALINNIELTGADPSKIDAMVVSHGHFDHYGGLVGFLQKYRNALPADVKLYAGGEDNFCRRYGGAPGALTEFLHHREDQTGEYREGAAEHAGRVCHEGRARLQRQPLPAGGDAG